MDRGSLPAVVSRRTFLGSSAAAALAAPFAARAAGANDKIAVGMIGLGIRGSLLLERLYGGSKDTAAVVAICDAYTGNLNKTCARIEALGGGSPKRYADYRELLQDKSIDAVIIATPEHLHSTMLIDALAAGKHAYSEKPLAHTIEEGRENPARRGAFQAGGAGRDAESQQFVVHQGQGNGGPGHDR
ncbi:MAG: Gfo/Idh/MocA family oxidoreductase [Ignavibacteriota bacterium]